MPCLFCDTADELLTCIAVAISGSPAAAPAAASSACSIARGTRLDLESRFALLPGHARELCEGVNAGSS